MNCEAETSVSTMECHWHHKNGILALAGVDSAVFVMPPGLGVKGRVKPPPGLERVDEGDEPDENDALEDMVRVGPSDDTDRAPTAIEHETSEVSEEAPGRVPGLILMLR